MAAVARTLIAIVHSPVVSRCGVVEVRWAQLTVADGMLREPAAPFGGSFRERGEFSLGLSVRVCTMTPAVDHEVCRWAAQVLECVRVEGR